MVADSGGRMMPIERKSKLKFRWWPNFGVEMGLWEGVWRWTAGKGAASGRDVGFNRGRTASITPIVSMAAVDLL